MFKNLSYPLPITPHVPLVSKNLKLLSFITSDHVEQKAGPSRTLVVNTSYNFYKAFISHNPHYFIPAKVTTSGNCCSFSKWLYLEMKSGIEIDTWNLCGHGLIPLLWSSLSILVLFSLYC